MSASPPEAQPPAPLPAGTIHCARCRAEVPSDADWCLSCGLAARTRVAPTPPWRIPVMIAASVAALALAALAVAFVELTKDPEPVAAPAAPVTTAAPTAPPVLTGPVPTATAPVVPPVETVPTVPETTPGATTPPETSPDSGGAVAPDATTPEATTPGE